jgi:hypothetical protein
VEYLGILPFLFVGGAVVGVQIHAAFTASWIAGRIGRRRTVQSMLYFWCLAIPFLALGGWFHPGNQWSAIGVTLVTACGLSLIGFMCHFVPNPAWRGGRVPDAREQSWVIGGANVAAIFALGLYLSWLGYAASAPWP